MEYFNKFYKDKDNIIKSFTFSVFFSDCRIMQQKLKVAGKSFVLNFSIADYSDAIILYNAFNNQRYKKFSINNNSWTLENIAMAREEEIRKDSINIKFLSPLCVRKRENNKDFYYSYTYSEMQEVLKNNIKEQLKITDLPQGIVDSFEIVPIEPKKVIIRFYEKKIECSIGKFNIKGNPILLNYLYQAGIGSKRSAGFGMFEIINE